MEQMVGSQQHIAHEAGEQMLRAAQEALAARGVFHLGVPGGSVATALFPVFADLWLDWSRVHIWWVDERVVPLDHADSNYRVAKELFLSKVPAAQVHPFQDAAVYERDLPNQLDVALLGVGPDGHIASLFPGHVALEESVKRAMAIDDSPKSPPKRLTLTLPELCKAREVWVVATGQTKALIMREALKPTSQLPLARLLRQAPEVRLWLDAPAASYL